MAGSLSPLLLLLANATGAAAQPFLSPTVPNDTSSQNTFRPSIAIVIGLFAVMFSLTFFLLMYAKFCHSSTNAMMSEDINDGEILIEERRPSGIDKAVIESLPYFRFSVLKGSRDGLECSVCLSRFDDAEILRLLPRCKHAFHMDCIDRWLLAHSSCPLCRIRVDAEDIAFFKLSSSSRYLRDPSGRLTLEIVEDGGTNSGLDLYVEREHALQREFTSRRFATGFRWAERLKFVAIGKPEPLHSFNHRILVSEAVFRSRWSDFTSADLISLESEMQSVISNKRFDQISLRGGGAGMISPEVAAEEVLKIKEEMERKRRLESRAVQMQKPSEEYSKEFYAGDIGALISPASRCMSDITSVRSYLPSGSRGEKEEKVRQMWMPIARRTVQWFAGKERATMFASQGRGYAGVNRGVKRAGPNRPAHEPARPYTGRAEPARKSSPARTGRFTGPGRAGPY